MIHNKISSFIFERLSPDHKVLDIGGGRFPWYRADYVIDKRQFNEKIENRAKGEINKPFYTEKNWISRDFFDLPWPFPDKMFDFVVCMGTLEDIRDPIAMCREKNRISKAGYISTPTRASESHIGISKHAKSNNLYGYFHHKWNVEIINGALVFKAKTPLLYQNRQWLIDDYGQHTLNFFWEGEFNYSEEYLLSHDEALKDLEKYHLEHASWLELKSKNPESALGRYNHWPKHWKNVPDFFETDPEII